MRFADSTWAYLPLPDSDVFSIATPDTMEFSGDTFTYSVRFEDEAVSSDGQSLIHLKGTYRYTVDLANKTVALTIDD
jgi:hypothetical protein